MKWAIGPRRLGKTTILLDQVLKYGKSCYVASPTFRMASTNLHNFVKLLEKKDIVFHLRKNDLTVMLFGKIAIEFGTAEKLLLPLPPSTGKEMKPPVFFDDMDLWLVHKIKRRIIMVTGTGPSYDWQIDLPEEMIKEAKVRMPRKEFLSQMTKDWI